MSARSCIVPIVAWIAAMGILFGATLAGRGMSDKAPTHYAAERQR